MPIEKGGQNTRVSKEKKWFWREERGPGKKVVRILTEGRVLVVREMHRDGN